MKPIARCCTVAALLMAAVIVPVAAQDPPVGLPAPAPTRPGAAAPPSLPLQVQIVIARYLNDKRVSSLPFSLSMSSAPGNKANVRMGGNVPVPSTVFTPQPAGDAKTAPLTSYTFQNVGTNIDVSAVPSVDARIGLNVTISETTLKPADPGSQVNVPSTNNYQSSNTVFVKDGETAQFTAATDRISGEVVRIEVTAKVVK
jgi:Bacterial type II and III secretion system protein